MLNVVRELLLCLQRDVTANNAESPVLAESTKLLEGLRPDAGEVGLDRHTAVLRDQQHKFVAQRLTQDATQMMTASCDAGNRISDCQEVINQGSLVRARRKTAQDEAHRTGAQRGTVAA